jgi:Flp pilus assembly protein TadG
MDQERAGGRRHRPSPSRPARRLHGDRGAILAEAAILTPFYLVLIFGILEFGAAFRDYLTLSNAATAGAREASIAANDAGADYQIIQAIQKASAAMPSSSILHIVVFHASSPDSTVPTGCAAGTPTAGSGSPSYTGACNTYTPTAFTWASTSVNWGCAATSADQYWCPSIRKSALTGTNGPPDYIGIYIQIRHDYFTGLFGKSITMSKTSVIKIEPQSLQ